MTVYIPYMTVLYMVYMLQPAGFAIWPILKRAAHFETGQPN